MASRAFHLFLAAPFPAVFASTAFGQVTFNFTYQDASGANGGFNDTIVDPGETLSRGQLRQNTINAVSTYMSTVFDGRGSLQLQWNPSAVIGGGTLAKFGPGVPDINGAFQNGLPYQVTRTGSRAVFAPPDGAGQFDFTTFSYNYVGANTNNSTKFDMFSIALHELTHGMGFISLTNSLGQGNLGNAVGTPGKYSVLDMYLQRGNGAGGQLFDTNITSSGYASFTGNVSTLTNGNDPTTGLFFGGQYAREVLGNTVPMFAPSTFQPGTSISHDNTTPNGVMNPGIAAGVVRQQYQAYEIAMLMDIGYNVYNWNGNTTSNWTGGSVNSLAATPWRTDLGIAYDGSSFYNMNSSQAQAPILAPYAQVTSNIVLNFAGTSAYTSTNDLGTMRMSRINLNSTAGSASTITGGTFIFGQNLDGSFSVLAPKIVQKNTGAFNIGSDIQIADPTRGLTVDGTGSGAVTFTGNLTGAGGFTKGGTFTVAMNGAANTYSGVTTVNQGVLQIGGAKTGTGAVTVNNTGILQVNGSMAGATTVNSGGRVRGTGTLSGSLAISSGGFIAPGNSAGNLTASGGVTMNAGTYDWELASLTTAGAGTNFDLITLSGGASTFGGTSNVQLNFALLAAGLDPNGSNAFWNAAHQWQIVQLFAGSFSGIFGSISNPNWTKGTFSLSSTGGGIFLGFSPVPEPSTFLLVFAGGLGLLLHRRRQSRAAS